MQLEKSHCIIAIFTVKKLNFYMYSSGAVSWILEGHIFSLSLYLLGTQENLERQHLRYHLKKMVMEREMTFFQLNRLGRYGFISGSATGFLSALGQVIIFLFGLYL